MIAGLDAEKVEVDILINNACIIRRKEAAQHSGGDWDAVMAVAPGYVATDNTQALQDKAGRAAGLMARIPADRWGKPEAIAWPVAFLASDLARFMHGAVVPVDGGWLSG